MDTEIGPDLLHGSMFKYLSFTKGKTEFTLQLPHVVSIEKNDKGIIRPLAIMGLFNIVD